VEQICKRHTCQCVSLSYVFWKKPNKRCGYVPNVLEWVSHVLSLCHLVRYTEPITHGAPLLKFCAGSYRLFTGCCQVLLHSTVPSKSKQCNVMTPTHTHTHTLYDHRPQGYYYFAKQTSLTPCLLSWFFVSEANKYTVTGDDTAVLHRS
jgi:hypothetical protein